MRWFATGTFTIVTALVLTSAGVSFADDAKQAQTHFDEGRRLIKKGQYPEAIKELEAAFALDPKNEQLFNLGVAHHLNGDLKAAAEFYRRFLAVESKGRTVATARKHLEQIEKVLAAKAADEQARAEVERQAREKQLAEEQRNRELQIAEDRERTAVARVATLEADLARAKLARDVQRGKVDTAREEAEAAGRQLVRWRASALAAPSGDGRKLRALSTVLIVGGAAALGAGGWNGVRAHDMAQEITDARGSWSTDLDRAVEDGQEADQRFQVLMPVGGVAALLGLFALGFGESWSTDRRDAKALQLRVAGPERAKP